MSDSAKDLVIQNLRDQIEQYKQKLASFNYEGMSTKISSLEKMLIAKDQEIMDLRAMAGGEGGDTELRTKNIVLQSKVRALETKISDMNAEKENLENKLKRVEKETENTEQLDALRKQLKQEMEKSERLRNQLNQLSRDSGQVSQMQHEIQQLKVQLAEAQNIQIKPGSGGANVGEMQKLKAELVAKDKKIKELEATAQSNAVSAAGGGPMATLRMQREINALKAQIVALKKSETELSQKLTEMARKNNAGWDVDT